MIDNPTEIRVEYVQNTSLDSYSYMTFSSLQSVLMTFAFLDHICLEFSDSKNFLHTISINEHFIHTLVSGKAVFIFGICFITC